MYPMLLLGAMFAAIALVVLVFANRWQGRGRRAGSGDGGGWSDGGSHGGDCDAGGDGGGCDGGGGGD